MTDDTEQSAAARVEVVVRKTRIGAIPAIRETGRESGRIPTTDAERELLIDYEEEVEEILHSLDVEDCESGEIVGHFEVAGGGFEWCPRSESGLSSTGTDQ